MHDSPATGPSLAGDRPARAACHPRCGSERYRPIVFECALKHCDGGLEVQARVQRRVAAAMTAVRLRTSINAYAMRVLEGLGHPPLLEDGAPEDVLRTSTIGVDPVRVLLFGGGLAVGYGAAGRAAALDHALARRMTDISGRGCSVTNRARRHVPLPETMRSLGAVGTHTYKVAVWCPPFTEATRRLNLRSWTTELHALIRDLRRDEHIAVVLLEMPHPAGNSPVALIARPWIHRINNVLRVVACEHDQVAVVRTGPIEASAPGEVVISAGYYREVADRTAEAVATLLHLTPTHATLT